MLALVMGQSGAGMVLRVEYHVEQLQRVDGRKAWVRRFRSEAHSVAEGFAKHVRRECLPVRVRPVVNELGRS